MEIKENIEIKPLTTIKIGGYARYFAEIENIDDLKKCIEFSKNKKIPFFILGGGSNIIVSDSGFSGLVIKMKNRKIIFDNEKNKVIADSGVILSKLINDFAEKGFSGMEWAAGIPGTLGGAIRGNAGAYGGQISDLIEEVEFLNRENMDVIKIKKENCGFGYRESRFKRNDKEIVISAVLKVKKGEKNEILEKMEKVIKERRSCQPLDFPSAGSFFVNPKLDNPKLFLEFKSQKGKEASNNILPAGWIIEESDLKHRRIGDAMVSDTHCNYIVNKGNAKAEDVVMLASLIKQQVRKKMNIQLREEIHYVGF